MKCIIYLFDGKKRSAITGMIVVILLLIIDQGTKFMAVTELRSQPPFILIKNVLELYYIENTGAAWGMFSGMKWLLVIVTVAAILLIVMLYFHISNEKKYLLLHFLLLALMAGAMGNMFDRIIRGYVVDFLYLTCIDFPIFNVADCYVTVSALAGIIIYRKELMEWMKNG